MGGVSARGLLVQKYGGTSVGTPERIGAVADRIAAGAKRDGLGRVIVVSAMGRTTDDLIWLARQVSADPPDREMDMLLTTGERISMALLSMALADRGLAAVSFTGSQSGILTDGAHRRARIRRILGDRVRAALGEGKVAIVAGFQGMSEHGKEITTLGRGGSDTTAVALAAALGARECEIWTDVDGIYSADPRVVPGARLWPRVPVHLMVELATRGAGVLHPRCVELANRSGVRVSVRNSLKAEGEGTVLMSTDQLRNEPGGMEEFRVLGVTADDEKILLTVKLARPSVLAALWQLAAEAHLTLIAPQFQGNEVRLFADQDSRADWTRLLGRMEQDGFVASHAFEDGIVPVSVVGERFAQDGAALQAIIETLAGKGVSVTMGSASALAVTCGVPRTHADDAVRALHERFLGDS